MKTQYEAKTLTLSDIPELNAVNSTTFREAVRTALKEGITTLDIDLSQTRLVDSSGLGALIALHKTMCARGGAVRILHPNPMVYQLMELTRLHRVFEIVKS